MMSQLTLKLQCNKRDDHVEVFELIQGLCQFQDVYKRNFQFRGILANVPTAPLIFPTSISLRTSLKRFKLRFISVYHNAILRQKWLAQHEHRVYDPSLMYIYIFSFFFKYFNKAFNIFSIISFACLIT